MEQRRHRLGDIVDDYCPRERRLANHVVVAMIGDDIRQTRCTTCDAEHIYKNAKVPPRRKKGETTGALVKQVAESLTEKPRLTADALTGDVEEPAVAPLAPRVVAPAPVSAEAPPVQAAPSDAGDPAADQPPVPDEPDGREQEDGPVHRQLIRATLPRVPGEEREARPIPEFTMRQVRDSRGFRPGGGRGNKPGNRGQKHRSAADFRPGVMSSSSWTPANQRPRGGGQQNGNRAPQQSRPGGRKKTR